MHFVDLCARHSRGRWPAMDSPPGYALAYPSGGPACPPSGTTCSSGPYRVIWDAKHASHMTCPRYRKASTFPVASGAHCGKPNPGYPGFKKHPGREAFSASCSGCNLPPDTDQIYHTILLRIESPERYPFRARAAARETRVFHAQKQKDPKQFLFQFLIQKRKDF